MSLATYERIRADQRKRMFAKQEADRILSFLAGLPSGNATASSRAVVREIMLQTGGSMLARGDYFDVKAKSLGGGVYRMTLERRA